MMNRSLVLILSFLSKEILATPYGTRSKCEIEKIKIVEALEMKNKEISSLFQLDEHGHPERICEPGYKLTWDVNFCMRVCLLQVGDECHPSSKSGIDLCPHNLRCQHDEFRTDIPPSCQPLLDVSFDDSSSLSYFYY
ncbi:Oidioi.mRNA.OKI2018_I69.chr1.g558.t1.cds [Oikopleura dioica]|uniref:Oidioi.mRNA.OKI2018_I69.chr1.g558.t1.cds n=1 Tax=Oikopleura dioica TaxID=34765 RepID=A0ABN7SQD8_OIKDI|nr:Oidioi.mRNA.OKI2018_I69.chr1.g558.t1.cds [Oikopleura dioica]